MRREAKRGTRNNYLGRCDVEPGPTHTCLETGLALTHQNGPGARRSNRVSRLGESRSV